MFFWATSTPKNTDETLQGAQVLKDKQGFDSENDGGKVEQVEVTRLEDAIGSWRMHVTLAHWDWEAGDKCGVCKESQRGQLGKESS